MYSNGLVIGKFHPPHLGHSYVINKARSLVESLHVLVCAFPGQDIPVELRMRWLRELHPDPAITIESLTIDFDPHSSEEWTRHVLAALGHNPDVMVSSETETGQRYAAMLGAQHVLVDGERLRYPCSGRIIHANPEKYKDCLAPQVYAWYVDNRGGTA